MPMIFSNGQAAAYSNFRRIREGSLYHATRSAFSFAAKQQPKPRDSPSRDPKTESPKRESPNPGKDATPVRKSQ